MQARDRLEEDGPPGGTESGPTVPSKAQWFSVALLSVGLLVTTFLLVGDTTAGELSGTGFLAMGLVFLICPFVAGTAMAQLFFAFWKEGGLKGPIKALIIFASGWVALTLVFWDGTPKDVLGATIVAGMGVLVFATPGVVMFVRARAKEDLRVRQEAERRQREAAEARRAARERLKREREEESKEEEARRAQAERERVRREQEGRKREEAGRANEGRKSSQGSGNNRRRGGEQRSAGDSGRNRPKSAGSQAATPHEVLGVAPGASEEEIRAAYKRLSQKYHPDKVSGLAPEYMEIAEPKMKEINAAYAQLKPKKR